MDIAAALICAEISIKELLDSSSSSDDELISKLISRNSKPHVKGFVENALNAFTETKFIDIFRISRESARHLIERYSLSYSKRNYRGGRIQTSVETHVLSFLWFCGNQTSFREVANVFNMSLSNVHRCFNSVLSFLVEDLGPEVIKFPRFETEKEEVATGFQNVSGIPNILGCIDKSYIAIRTPKFKIPQNCAAGQSVVLTLQAICDSNLRFLDVCTSISSNIHESQILELSVIGKQLPSLCYPKYYLLGGSEYPLREYLLTSFVDYGNLSDSENHYNKHFCRARVKIEKAFNVLKWRFLQLMRMDFHNAEIIEKFVTACCVLHNICILRNETLPVEISNTELRKVNGHTIECDRKDILLHEMGEKKREEVKNLLLNLKT